MNEPLRKCHRCGFPQHVRETECVKCQVLDAQEIQLKREIAKYYRARYSNLRQRYDYLENPNDLQGWADGTRRDY